MTVFASLLTFVYLVHKFIVLAQYGDSVLAHSTIYGAFNSDYGYTENQGFQVAFGVRSKPYQTSSGREVDVTVEQVLKILDFQLVHTKLNDIEIKLCSER